MALALTACRAGGPVDPLRSSRPSSAATTSLGSCTLHASAWEPFVTSLGFRASSPPFALIMGNSGVEAEVSLAAPDAREGASTTFRSTGFRLQGVLAAGEVPLSLARPQVFAGCIAPRGRALVAWKGSRGPQIDVGLPTGPGFRLRSGAERFSVACGDLTLQHADYPPAVVPHGAEVNLRGGRQVAFSATTTGPPVFTLTVDPQGFSTKRLARVPGRSLLAFWSGDVVVFGWVSNDDVSPTFGYIAPDRDSGPDADRNDWGDALLLCSSALSFDAEVAGERQSVGIVEAGTRIELRGVRGDATIVDFPRAPFWAARDASFLPSANLAACQRL